LAPGEVQSHGVSVHVILTCGGVTRHPPSSGHVRLGDGHHPAHHLPVGRRAGRQDHPHRDHQPKPLHGLPPQLSAACLALWYFSSSSLARTMLASFSATAPSWLPGRAKYSSSSARPV